MREKGEKGRNGGKGEARGRNGGETRETREERRGRRGERKKGKRPKENDYWVFETDSGRNDHKQNIKQILNLIKIIFFLRFIIN